MQEIFIFVFHYFDRVMQMILVQMVKKKRKKAVTVQKMMFDEVVIMKKMNVVEIQIDEAQLAVMNVEVMAKKINVKKSQNQNQYPNVELMLKFHELFRIWAKIFIL